jgi:hypothetical protein
MKKICLGLIALMGVAALAADPTPLDVKTGEWEVTATSQNTAAAMIAIPPERLAQMTPDQRAKMEGAMKQLSRPTTTTSKRCIKKEDLTKVTNWTNNKNCKEALVNSTSSKLEVHVECSDKQGIANGTLRLDVVNSEAVKFDMQATVSMNGQSAPVSSSGTGKWVSSTCTEK